MDLLNETVLLKTKSTPFNLLIRETSPYLCYERLLIMTYVAYKNAFFRKMQFWSHCYTVVSYQALSRLLVYKIPAVYLSGAKNKLFILLENRSKKMLNKQTVQTIGIQAENMNKQRKLPKKMNGKARKIGHLIGLADVIETRKLVD